VEDLMIGFAACFKEIEDPRTGNSGRHDLLEILMIALCAVLCGGQTAVDMTECGRAKEGFLRRFLKLERGIPGLSARPRHYAQNGKAIEDFRRIFPPRWQRCGPPCRPEPT
jgi:hypothetical protein